MSGIKLFIAAAYVAMAAAVIYAPSALADSSYYIYFGSSRQHQRQECVAHRGRTCHCARCERERRNSVTVISPGRSFGGSVISSDRRYFSSSGTKVIIRSDDIRAYPYASYEYHYYQYGGTGYGVHSSSSAGFGGAVGDRFLLTPDCPTRESRTRSRPHLDDKRRDHHDRSHRRR